MSDVDQIAAVKALLEMVTADNEELIEKFKDVRDKLETIEGMPPGIRSVQFRQLEQAGAFNFNNVDIRHFATHTKKPLTPPQFVERTSRRLHNTESLIGKFLEHEDFEGGKQLQSSLESLNSEIVDRNDQAAVIRFKKKVEALRDTPLFKNYLSVRNQFLKSNKELKDEADLMAAKETVADGEMMAQDQQEEIKDLAKGVESGEVSAEDAHAKLEAMENEAETADGAQAAAPAPAADAQANPDAMENEAEPAAGAQAPPAADEDGEKQEPSPESEAFAAGKKAME